MNILLQNSEILLKKQLINTKKKLERIVVESNNMQKILNRLKYYHSLKMKAVLQEARKLSGDYKELLDLMQELSVDNKDLICSLKLDTK